MSNQQYGPPPQQYGGPPGPPPQQYWGPPQGPPQGPPPQYGPPQYGPPQYGPPPGGPGFGFGGNGYPPPKKKRSKAPFVVVPLVLLFAGVLSLYLFALHAKQERRNNYSSPSPTTSTSYSPTTQPTYYPTGTRPTATQPTEPRPTQPTPTKTEPPPPSDVDLTARNKFYSTGIQKSVNCREPKDRPVNEAGARKYYSGIMACLNRAWPAQVRAAGYQWEGVRMQAYWGTGYSPCGNSVRRSFYCAANRQIYMDAQSDVQNWKKYPGDPISYNWVRAAMMDTTAHEFGHHIQAITGILSASRRIQYERSGDKALEMSRRKEIQATCFGQVFIGANKRNLVTSGVRKQMIWLNQHSGDEYDTVRDHGSRAVQPYWADRGYNSRNVAQCNTYTAGPQYVR